MPLLIVGSGRCGTKSAAAALGGTHEPYSEVLVPAATHLTLGLRSLGDTVSLLGSLAPLPEVSAHYRHAELLPAWRIIYPDLKVLWLTRDKPPTVASMIRNRWYDPRSDDEWPVLFAGWRWANGNGALVLETPHNPWRLNPVLLGETAWGEYRWWPQGWRCDWWVSWSDRLCRSVFDARLDVTELEAGLPEIGEWAGVEVGEVPHLV